MRHGRNFNERKNPEHVNLILNGNQKKKKHNYRKLIIILVLVILTVDAGSIIIGYLQSSDSTSTSVRENEALKEVHSDKLVKIYGIDGGKYYKVMSNDTFTNKTEISKEEYDLATS